MVNIASAHRMTKRPDLGLARLLDDCLSELSTCAISDQLSERRKRPGVSPVTRRKFAVRWLWLENPTACAISAIERSPSRRSSKARWTRLSTTNWCGGFPTEILNASTK
jgi:hypothetical protein